MFHFVVSFLCILSLWVQESGEGGIRGVGFRGRRCSPVGSTVIYVWGGCSASPQLVCDDPTPNGLLLSAWGRVGRGGHVPP